jgi:uncharacterized membrane protein YdbT with pleckstrin-like domain
MNQSAYIPHFRTVILRPNPVQFIIDEFPVLPPCLAGLAYGGMEKPLSGVALAVSLMLGTFLLYRYVSLRRIRYRIGEEQFVCESGVFQRKVDYLELYRVVDFHEHQTLLQQVLGLKTVRIYSTDRNAPRQDLTGIRKNLDIVHTIRERVEYNRKKKGIYEITNH